MATIADLLIGRVALVGTDNGTARLTIRKVEETITHQETMPSPVNDYYPEICPITKYKVFFTDGTDKTYKLLTSIKLVD